MFSSVANYYIAGMCSQKSPLVKGAVLDAQTRCSHYHSPLDVIAIRFKCCGDYYPCVHCHEEAAGHPVQRWPKSEWNEKGVLCGVCKHELSINEYFENNYSCPHCGVLFNPGCRKHNHFYFEMER